MPIPSGADDPNAEILDGDRAHARRQRPTRWDGKLEVIRIPSPGLVVNELGEAAPASHMNFVIANGVVAVPVYGTPSADARSRPCRRCFPAAKSWASPRARLLGSGIAGGGSFHCITREEPA